MKKKYLSNGVDISYVDTDISATAIVFTNGVSMTTDSWCNQFQDQRLSSSYRLITFDWPGTGDSDALHKTAQYHPSQLARLLCQFLEQQVATDFILVAASYASNIVGEIISSLPRCKGIVLHGSSLIGGAVSLDQVLQPSNHPPIIAMEQCDSETVAAYYHWAVLNNPAFAQQLIQNYFKTDPRFRAAIGAFMTEASCTDEPMNLIGHHVPLLFIHGEYDPIVKPVCMAEIFPSAAITETTIAGAGHFAFAEQPAAFNDALIDFANRLV
ncbi:alpha/beta fold hydrolase [Phnomibacter sp. MR]|uniref:alpha/beta fold hydrolase n=1 Tax=Phnomibacter sp. MR TaxID=3042318 RepID=UPI003A812287